MTTENDSQKGLSVRTSEDGWLKKIAAAYKARDPIVIIDDANVGIDPRKDSILEMGRRAKLSPHEWAAVGIAMGVAVSGVYLLVTAILDPEPFSKMAFALGAGTSLILGGGFTAIRVLAKVKPPNVKVTRAGIEIWWT